MDRIYKYKNHGKRFFTCERCCDDEVVREGLAYSPSDISRLTDRGMPVNSLMTGKAFIDGEENPSFHVTSDRARYADVADLWEEHQIIKEKARAAAKAKKFKKPE